MASQDFSRMLKNKPVNISSRIIESTIKYHNRMTTRPTPYGIFAGVSTCKFGKNNDMICLDDRKKYKKSCRVDGEWYFKLVKIIEENRNLLMDLKVIFNKNCYKKNSRLKNPYYTNLRRDKGNHVNDVDIRYTQQVKFVEEFSREFVSYKDLYEFLLSQNPQIPSTVIDKFLENLIINEFLLSNIRMIPQEEDSLHYLLKMNTFAKETHEEESLIDSLFKIERLRIDYENESVGKGKEKLDELSLLMSDVVKSKNYVNVKLQLSVINNTIDESIKKDMQKFANLICDLTTIDNESFHIKAYKEFFKEKYGVNARVALSEVINPNEGIGLPYEEMFEHRAQLKIGQAEKLKSEKLLKLQSLIDEKIIFALKQGQSVVEISDGDVERIRLIGEEELKKFKYASSYSLNTIVVKKESDYVLFIGPNVGSSQAGFGTSRFNNLLDDDFAIELEGLYENEKKFHDEDYAIVDVYELSKYLRNVNLYTDKLKYDYSMYIGMCSSNYKESIGLEELYIGIDNNLDRLFIWSNRLNKKVKVVTDSMLNGPSSNPIIRLLREISYCYELQPFEIVFTMKNYSKLQYTPMLKYENIVISNEIWRIHPDCFFSSNFEEFSVELKQYIENWNIPQYIYYSDYDQRLLINLKETFFINFLYKHLVKKRNDVVLEKIENEYYNQSLVIDKTNQSYAAELTIPFYKAELFDPKPDVNKSEGSKELPNDIIESFNSLDRVLYPGDEGWLYFKIYLQYGRANDFLISYLESFLSEPNSQVLISKIFFIRYSDPNFHIRLRLQSSSGIMSSELITVFRDWFNILRDNHISYKYSIHQYEREVERYGGSSLMADAENYFYHDSLFVLSMLKDFEKNQIEVEEEKMCIFVVFNFIHEFFDDLQLEYEFLSLHTNNDWFKDKFRKNKIGYLKAVEDSYVTEFSIKTQQIFQLRTKVMKEYMEKIRYNNTVNQLTNSIDDLLLTLIHMFCNRYKGNQDWEQRILFLTRHTVQARLNAKTHSSLEINKERKS